MILLVTRYLIGCRQVGRPCRPHFIPGSALTNAPNEISISGNTCEKIEGDKVALSLLLTILGSWRERGERERELDPLGNV